MFAKLFERRDVMQAFRVFLCSLLVVLTAGSNPVRADDTRAVPQSDVKVIDGDTIEVHGRVIDLYGIDAPELGQVCLHNGTPWQCGLEAAFALRQILTVEHAGVRCRHWPNANSSGPMVCEAGPVDVARVLISSGHVIVLPDAFPDYRELEHRAKKANVGLWRGRFIAPRDWRSGRRLPKEELLRSDLSACPVKARIDGAGRRIYLVPTDHRFRSVRVAPERGERCFLADEAARAAGWRRPGELAAVKTLSR